MIVDFKLVDLILVSPIIALFLTSLIPLTVKVLQGNKEPNSMATMGYGLIGVIAAFGLLMSNVTIEKTAFSRSLIFDGMSYWTGVIVLAIAAVTLILCRDHRATSNGLFSEFVFLLLNATGGMLLVAWANDLVTLFIGIEMMSLCLYVMIALNSEERFAKESAFKYFLLGSFASAIMLYGISFLYGTAGSQYLPDLAALGPELITTNRLFLVGTILLVCGLLFKVSIFPFHAWTPDVYQGAATPLTGYMATGVKAVSLVFILRFMLTGVFVAPTAEGLIEVLQWLSILTILVGNVGAIMQKNLKRMLAYSSVAHSGYVLMGLIAAAVAANSSLGSMSVLFYLFAYSLMTIGAFGVISLLERSENMQIDVDHLRGLSSKAPVMCLVMSVLLLSLAGIPPTVGFFGKLFLFQAAVEQNFIWLAVWGAIGSVISVFYYLRPIVSMYMLEGEGLVPAFNGRNLSVVAVVASAIFVVVSGLFSSPFYELVLASVARIP